MLKFPIILRRILAGLAMAVPASIASADTAADAKAEERAFAWEALYRADFVANASGGLRRKSTLLGNLDLKLSADLDKAWGWKGSSAFVHAISSHGGKPNAKHVGSGQGIDNIEVDTNTAKIFQAWVQQQLFDDRLSVLLGLYDLNSEFYSTQSSGLFLHPAPGIGSELAQTGRNGPSIFPVSSVALRAKFQLLPSIYLQGVVLDGVPGDPDNPRGTHIQFNRGDGALRVAEVGYAPGGAEGDSAKAPLAKLAFGVWSYTSRFDDLADVDAAGDPGQRTAKRGFSAIPARAFGDRMAGFLRVGLADPDVNPYARYVQAGLVFTGLVPGRPADQLGLSFSAAGNGGKFLAAARAAGEPADRRETALEITYRAPLAPWLTLQPVIHRIINPGTDPRIKDATVLGVRFEFALGK